jgi:hypothetical protein
MSGGVKPHELMSVGLGSVISTLPSAKAADTQTANSAIRTAADTTRLAPRELTKESPCTSSILPGMFEGRTQSHCSVACRTIPGHRRSDWKTKPSCAAMGM